MTATDQTVTDEEAVEQEVPETVTAESEVEQEIPVTVEVQAPVSREAEELRSDLMRLQAEYVNYKKRVDRDRDVARSTAIHSVLSSLLPVLDDIEAARKHEADLAGTPVDAILTKLETVLTGFGLDRIDETNVPFDPMVHEAMIRQPHAEIADEHVSQVFRTGYASSTRVIRAAQVMVSSGQ